MLAAFSTVKPYNLLGSLGRECIYIYIIYAIYMYIYVSIHTYMYICSVCGMDEPHPEACVLARGRAGGWAGADRRAEVPPELLNRHPSESSYVYIYQYIYNI